MSIESDIQDNSRFLRNLKNLKKAEKEKEIDNEDNDSEDLYEMLQNTEKAFKLGDNQSTSKYSPSPAEILRDYEEFN